MWQSQEKWNTKSSKTTTSDNTTTKVMIQKNPKFFQLIDLQQIILEQHKDQCRSESLKNRNIGCIQNNKEYKNNRIAAKWAIERLQSSNTTIRL